MHIQLAHFFTSDPYLAFFVTLAVTAMVMAVTTPATEPATQRRWFVCAAVVLGLAIGSKFSAILLGLAMALATYWGGSKKSGAILGRWLGYSTLLLITFFVTNPFAILDNSCTAAGDPIFSLSVNSCYLQNISQQSGMVRGSLAFPFIRQYEATTPFLYPLEMQLRWGMGGSLGLFAFAGFFLWSLWVGRRAWQARSQLTPQLQAELLLIAWCWPFFLSTGSFYVKFMRYLQPLTPFLMLFAAWLLWQLPLWWRRVGTAVVIVSTAAYALAFVQIYNQPHPWTSASQWIYDEVPHRQTITVELWDEPLPALLEGDNGQILSRRLYQQQEINWLSRAFASDTESKVQENLAILANSDIYIVASQRGYAVTSRLPQTYPASHPFYSALFSEALGYELAFIADRPPRLGQWLLTADLFTWAGVTPPTAATSFYEEAQRVGNGRVDESFVVYDQPTVMIFVNKERRTAAEMWQAIHAQN